MAFYIQHQPQQAKEKVSGFNAAANNNPPSPTSTFDPSSLFFNGPMFPDPFRQPSGSNSAIDFTDTLLSLIPENQQQQQQQQQPQNQPTTQSSAHMNVPHFDMAHFSLPPFQQLHQTPRDDDSPASLQTTHSFFNDSHNHTFAAPASIPSYMGRPDTPATSVGAPSDSSPFPTHTSHARMHSHRSPSVGPNGVSASRSRSRSRTSKPPPASRNGIPKTKRTSISSTPEEIAGIIGGAPAPAAPSPPAQPAAAGNPSRPQAILIPSHSQPTQHRDFATHQLNSLGPHPISPLGIHSTQTAPSAWYVPQTNPNGLNTAVEGSFSAIHGGAPQSSGDTLHTNRFSSSFIGSATRSLSLGTSPKPGTSASASVLAGSLGSGGKTPIVDPTMDAAAKQAAIISEKRRRRRESHNAVERRRRDNINEKISELSTLLPECMLDPAGATAGTPTTPIPTTAEGLLPMGSVTKQDLDDDGKDTGGMKANKGIILRKSVEYIRYLQQLVRVQANRNRELESELSHYRKPGTGSSGDDTPSKHLADSPNGNTGSNPFAGLQGMNMNNVLPSSPTNDDDNMSMSGLFLSHLSPEDTTAFNTVMNGVSNTQPSHSIDATVKMMMETSPSAASEEEEEERGRAVERRGRFGGGGIVNTGEGSIGAGGSIGGSAKRGLKRFSTGRGSRSVGFDVGESALSETEELDEMEMEQDGQP